MESEVSKHDIAIMTAMTVGVLVGVGLGVLITKEAPDVEPPQQNLQQSTSSQVHNTDR